MRADELEVGIAGSADVEMPQSLRLHDLAPAAEITAIATAAVLAAGLSLILGGAIDASVNGQLDRLHVFYRLLVVDESVAITSLLVVAVGIALAYRGFRWMDRIVSLVASRPLGISVAVMVALSAGALLLYRNYPLSLDEYAPLFQAQAFARGALTGHVPPDVLPRLFGPGFLGFFFTGSMQTGHVVSNYWPGQALLLTPFVLLGIPWLLNPLLAAGSLLLIHRLTRELTDDVMAPGWAVLLTVASPAFLANGMSFYSMPGHLFLNLLFVILLLAPTPKRLVLAGLVGSLALNLHNPYAHMLFAAPWIAWVCWRRKAKAVALLAVGYFPLTFGLGAGWLVVRWKLHSASIASGTASWDLPGDSFSEKAGTLVRFVFSAPKPAALAARAAEFVKLWIWAVPALPAVAVLGLARRASSTPVRLLAASAALTLVGYVFVSFPQGHGWGSRYFYPAWMVLPVFAALWITSGRPAARAVRERVLGGLALASLALLNTVAMVQMNRFITGQLQQLPEVTTRETPVVVLLDASKGYYVGDLIHNDPMLRRSPIFLRSEGEAADAAFMAEHFPALRLESRHAHGTVWAPPGRSR